MKKERAKIQAFCGERFKESYDLGEIIYSYDKEYDIDETEWYINNKYHLYYCPFCGAFIKGCGYGDYDKAYPPAKGVRKFKQRAER